MGRRAWLCSLWLGLSLAGCVCHDSECGSTESGELTLFMEAEELDGAQAVACRNDACQTVSLQAIADGEVAEGEQALLQTLTPSPTPAAELSALARATVEGFELSFVWFVRDTDDVRAGDVLSVRIVGERGDELLAKMGHVGPASRDDSDSCGPACLNASAKLE